MMQLSGGVLVQQPNTRYLPGYTKDYNKDPGP